jgi:ribosomal protein L29
VGYKRWADLKAQLPQDLQERIERKTRELLEEIRRETSGDAQHPQAIDELRGPGEKSGQ